VSQSGMWLAVGIVLQMQCRFPLRLSWLYDIDWRPPISITASLVNHIRLTWMEEIEQSVHSDIWSLISCTNAYEWLH